MRTCLLLALLLLLPTPGIAQSPEAEAHARPGPISAESSAGYVGFFDDGVLAHGGFGGALRVNVAPRVSLGPELFYMIGPGHDRDLHLLVNATFDLRPRRPGQSGRVEPYLLVGAGLLNHSDNSYYAVNRTSAAWSWGGGARVWVSRRVYLASDVRMGWEPHIRVTTAVGVVGR